MRFAKQKFVILGILLLSFLLLFSSLAGIGTVSAEESSESTTTSQYQTVEEVGTFPVVSGIQNVEVSTLNGKKIGVLTGTPYDTIAQETLENPEIVYFNTITDAALALQNGKIDAYLNNTIQCNLMTSQYPDLTYLDQVVYHFENGALFAKSAKGDTIRAQFNQYLQTIKANGTLDQLKSYWFSEKDWEVPAIPTAGENGTISLITCSSMKPFSFILNGQNAGFDIQIMADFCRAYGYGLQVSDADFAGMLTGIAAGKFDVAAGQLAYTEERAKNANYSDLYATQEVVYVVRKADYGVSGTSSGTTLAYSSLSALKQAKTFGCVTGTIYDTITQENFPDAEILYFNSVPDMALALQQGKLDAFLYDKPICQYLSNSMEGLGVVPELLQEEEYYFGFAKTENGEKLQGEFNAWLSQKRADGTLEALKQYWITEENPQPVETSGWDTPNGTINISFTLETRPSNYILEGQPAGYPAAVMAAFCKENGYGMDLQMENATASLASLATGKDDIWIDFLSYTEERANSILFSDSIYSGGLAVLCRAETTGGSSSGDSTSFFSAIGASFQRTFIDESRWILILQGLLVTLIITAGGFLLANLIGTGICALSMSKRKVLRGIADVYSRIMQGTPIVVILMILYYIVFGNVDLSAEVVAMIGFGITTGAYLAQLFKGAIQGIPVGQWEASLALGFTKAQTFRDIILPQAIRTMLPGYFSELINLMKGTAIVGYIAVVDLTKVGDIIRSSTYEAFFPLLSIAAIYFLIACILLSVLKHIQKRLAPKRMQKGGKAK